MPGFAPTSRFTSAEIAREQIAAGAIGMTAATVWEARALVLGGVGDILIANEVVSPAKAALLAELARDARITLAVDDCDVVSALAAAARAHGSGIGVLVEVDVGCTEAACARSTRPERWLAGCRWRGHRASRRDGVRRSRRAEPDRGRRAAQAREAMDDLARYAQALEDDGHTIEVVSAGGTNTYDMTGLHASPSCRPGRTS